MATGDCLAATGDGANCLAAAGDWFLEVEAPDLRLELDEYISHERLTCPPAPLTSKEDPVWDLWFRR